MGANDLFEDYRLVGGVRFATDFDSNEYLLSFENLKQQLDNPNDFEAVTSLLGMELVIAQESVHPSVAWYSEPWKQAVNS